MSTQCFLLFFTSVVFVTEYALSDGFEKHISQLLLWTQHDLWTKLVWQRFTDKPLPFLMKPLITLVILLFVVLVHVLAFFQGRFRHPYAIAVLSEVYTYSKRKDLGGGATSDVLNDKRFWKRLFLEKGAATPLVYGVYTNGVYKGVRDVVGRAIWKPVQGSRGEGIHFQWPGVFQPWAEQSEPWTEQSEPWAEQSGVWILEEFVEDADYIIRIVTTKDRVFESYKIKSDSFLTNWSIGPCQTTAIESSLTPLSGLQVTDPAYTETKRTAQAMHASLREIHSVGWDVLVTKKGDVYFLEGNTTHAVCQSGWTGTGAIDNIEPCIRLYLST